jgi:RNA-directed DNA polymerase
MADPEGGANPSDIAALLGQPLRLVNYFLYALPEAKRYREFQIRKRAGGERTISAPIRPIKTMQRALAKWFATQHKPHSHAHGYVDHRDILTNADQHLRQRWVLRVDLKDFFPTIHFGRVRGLLLKPPYSLPEDVARVLAHLCCHRGVLPQGAPSSPIVTNMVCRRLDRELAKLAREHRCRYTRYADDLVFSTRQRAMPAQFVGKDPQTGIITAGAELQRVIEGNGFTINDGKTRLYPNTQRQLVTGLVVNDRRNVPREYVRQLRNQIHAWRRHGPEVAKKLVMSTDVKNRPTAERPDFRLVLRGRVQHVGHVRGWNSSVYQRLARALAQVDDGFRPKETSEPPTTPGTVYLFCEGPTDYDHIEAAHRHFRGLGRFVDIDFHFGRDADIEGDDQLLKRCEAAAPNSHAYPHVFLFDDDNARIRERITVPGGGPRKWSAGVYSLAISKPPWRQHDDRVCIEMLYSDEDLHHEKDGRRLFLRKEFDDRTGQHIADEPTLNCRDKEGDQSLVAKRVVDLGTKESRALSKADFAKAILSQEPGFASADFSGFEATLAMVQAIVVEWRTNNHERH